MSRKDTVVPRFGLDTVQSVTYVLDGNRHDLDVRQVGILEDKINSKFEEPSQLDSLQHSFRSEVSYDKMVNWVTVKTTASSLYSSELEEIAEIIRMTMGLSIKHYEVRSSIGRKSMAADFL